MSSNQKRKVSGLLLDEEKGRVWLNVRIGEGSDGPATGKAFLSRGEEEVGEGFFNILHAGDIASRKQSSQTKRIRRAAIFPEKGGAAETHREGLSGIERKTSR